MRKTLHSKTAVLAEDHFHNDRVRANTDSAVNARIDAETDHRLKLYAQQSPDVINQRLRELDREWDIERVLERNASGLILGGLTLGAIASRKWFVLPFTVAGFLLQHALQGWCPPLALLRRRGVRTSREIERERWGLKAFLAADPGPSPVAEPERDEHSSNGGEEPKPRGRHRNQ